MQKIIRDQKGNPKIELPCEIYKKKRGFTKINKQINICTKNEAMQKLSLSF